MAQVGVILDANVIWGNDLRDLLIQMHDDAVIRAYVSQPILDECERTILAKRNISPSRFKRTRALMELAFLDAIVEDFHDVAPNLTLPDQGDLHVARAAIAAGAEAIVTFNLHDFPAVSLLPYGVLALHPDEWLCALLDDDPLGVVESAHRICARRSAPKQEIAGLADALTRAGVPMFAARLKSLAQGV